MKINSGLGKVGSSMIHSNGNKSTKIEEAGTYRGKKYQSSLNTVVPFHRNSILDKIFANKKTKENPNDSDSYS